MPKKPEKRDSASRAKSSPLPARPRRKKAAIAPSLSSTDAVGSNQDPVLAADEASRQAIRLSFLIHDVSRMRRAAYDQIMKPFKFTRARWWVLANLSRHDGMMQSQLADVLDVGKASLGSVVEQLEADGLVERRSDPSDKRAKRVYLTRSAQAVIKKMTLEEDEFNRQVLGSLGAPDRASLIRLLSLIKESLLQLPRSDSEADVS